MAMRAIWIALSVLLACGFDSAGQGESSDSGTGSNDGGSNDGGSDDGGSDDGGSDDGGSDDGGSDDGGSDDGGSGDGGSGSTDGGATGSGDGTSGGPTTDGTTTDGTTTGDATTSDTCAGFTLTEIFPAADGTVEQPMDVYGDPNEPPGIWAQSEVAEQGTITWEVHLDCAATVYLWAVVWDLRAGDHDEGDADSFYLSVDDESPEWLWEYGCTSTQDGWSYQPATHNDANAGCTEVELDWDLAAGAHTVRLRNREGSDYQGAAAVARMLVTTDAGLVPNMQDH
jgi:hypothetical protein